MNRREFLGMGLMASAAAGTSLSAFAADGCGETLWTQAFMLTEAKI